MFAPDKVAEFYCLNPYALQFIKVADFQTIKFYIVSLALSYRNLKEKDKYKGTVNSNIC